MGLDHGRVHIGVPHQFLDRADVLSTIQQMDGEGMVEGMGCGWFMDAARQHSPARPIPQRRWGTFWPGHGEVPPGRSPRPGRSDGVHAPSAGAAGVGRPCSRPPPDTKKPGVSPGPAAQLTERLADQTAAAA